MADVRGALLTAALLGGVAACETSEVAAPPLEPVPETVAAEPAPPPALAPEPPRGALIVRMHAASDAEMPDGAVATVTLEGSGGRHSAVLPKGRRLARLDGLEPGRYDLRMTVGSRGVEVGSFAYFVDVSEEVVGDVTVRVDYQRADLVVEATVEASSDRRYAGTVVSTADTCPGAATGGSVPADLLLATDGERFEITLEKFQQETLRLSGRAAPANGPVAAGTFESSAGPAGAWRLAHLTAPTPRAIAAVLEFDDGMRACRSTLEYAGLLEKGPATAMHGPDDAGPAVEVVGHGRTWTATLGRDASTATFGGLLVGPYDVFVGFGAGEGAADGRRETVLLTSDGARVATTFRRAWAPPAAPALAAGADYAPLGGTYRGKSVVASGQAACTGSITLVDTTELAFAVRGRALTMTFDSFYGRVLELTGEAGDAAGTYRSSDGKTGSWAIEGLAAPTSRSLAALVEFDNETDGCRATYEFVGVR